MDWIVAILVGALVGWLASMVMKTDAEQGPLMNIVIGIVGGLLGALIFGRWLGFSSAQAAGTFSWMGILWAFLGSLILIGILKAFRVLR